MLRQKKREERIQNEGCRGGKSCQVSETEEECKMGAKRLRNGGARVPPKNRNPYETIEEIPQIELTLAQMKGDPIELIRKLQREYSDYGAVKIIACPEWQPRFCFRNSEKLITTRIQKLHKLCLGKENYEEYTIKTFTEMAEQFERDYQFRFQRRGASVEGQKEQEYWSIVNGGEIASENDVEKVRVTVQYAADLPVQKFGSGFPLGTGSKYQDGHFDYSTSLYNLNNMYKCGGSMLAMSDQRREKISGVTTPWVYMGMLFSSFCWHVEDLWLNSLNYNHCGSTKTWYVVPEGDKEKFDEYVITKTGKRQFLNSITYMLDPLELIAHGIRVYKAYQRPREYVLTLFNAYHAGFSQGFNVGEAVNVVTVDSLAVIRKFMAVSAATKGQKAPVISYEWLLANNLNNPTIPNDKLQVQYGRLATQELQRLKKFLLKQQIKSIKIVDNGLKYDRLSCWTCKYYQYLSALECVQCAKRYCLQHAERCCGKGFVLVAREPDAVRRKVVEMVREAVEQ